MHRKLNKINVRSKVLFKKRTIVHTWTVRTDGFGAIGGGAAIVFVIDGIADDEVILAGVYVDDEFGQLFDMALFVVDIDELELIGIRV